jgi:hypothetical protein
MIAARAAGCFSPRVSTTSRERLRTTHGFPRAFRRSANGHWGEQKGAPYAGCCCVPSAETWATASSLRLLFCGEERSRELELGGIAPAARSRGTGNTQGRTPMMPCCSRGEEGRAAAQGRRRQGNRLEKREGEWRLKIFRGGSAK